MKSEYNLEELYQEEYVDDGHQHVYLQDPRTEKIIVITKKDKPGKIDALLRKGYEIVHRPY